MKEGGGGGEGRKLPAILLAPFFAQSLTPVPRSLLPYPTETLATQAISPLKPLFVVVLLFAAFHFVEHIRAACVASGGGEGRGRKNKLPSLYPSPLPGSTPNSRLCPRTM